MDKELKKKIDEVYDKHTKRNDGRCPGFHAADSGYVPEVYNQILERDFIDDICEED